MAARLRDEGAPPRPHVVRSRTTPQRTAIDVAPRLPWPNYSTLVPSRHNEVDRRKTVSNTPYSAPVLVIPQSDQFVIGAGTALPLGRFHYHDSGYGLRYFEAHNCTPKNPKRRINLKTAIKRKDAKHAKERKGKYRETILTRLVIFIFALRVCLSLRTLRLCVEIAFSRINSGIESFLPMHFLLPK